MEVTVGQGGSSSVGDKCILNVDGKTFGKWLLGTPRRLEDDIKVGVRRSSL
jgi:hypothetical protein